LLFVVLHAPNKLQWSGGMKQTQNYYANKGLHGLRRARAAGPDRLDSPGATRGWRETGRTKEGDFESKEYIREKLEHLPRAGPGGCHGCRGVNGHYRSGHGRCPHPARPFPVLVVESLSFSSASKNPQSPTSVLQHHRGQDREGFLANRRYHHDRCYRWVKWLCNWRWIHRDRYQRLV
jgi:hypothetical protein